jgi:hypothetical protein
VALEASRQAELPDADLLNGRQCGVIGIEDKLVAEEIDYLDQRQNYLV